MYKKIILLCFGLGLSFVPTFSMDDNPGAGEDNAGPGNNVDTKSMPQKKKRRPMKKTEDGKEYLAKQRNIRTFLMTEKEKAFDALRKITNL